jgi:16S rRNA (uracil1498-N3)-methyltransferase
MRRRFFVQGFTNKQALIEGQTAYHLARVLRAEPGQEYELSDGQHVWLGRIERVSPDRVQFELIEEVPAYQSRVQMILLLSVVKFDAFEWAIEKATELGVATIVPLAAARSEKGLLAAVAKRSQRWEKILLEASQQSRRVQVPSLKPLLAPAVAFGEFSSGVKIMLSERSEAQPLSRVLAGPSAPEAVLPAILAVGPEGGWTAEEFEYAADAGFREASLGRLILRTETAVTAALAVLNFASED